MRNAAMTKRPARARNMRRWLAYAILIQASLIAALPFVWMVFG